MSDFYKTLKGVSQGIYKEKMSKFIAIAQPAASADEAKALIKQISNKYHDARHCCWAYMIGTGRNEYLSSDNGEPSGTAGKPILGQINSFGITNVVIAVVRYFGGIKLGTSGLIVAYREAARAAIEAGEILECDVEAKARLFLDLVTGTLTRLISAKEKEREIKSGALYEFIRK